MTEAFSSYRVGLEGASSLLGKEILAVLKTRNFPVAYVIELAESGEEPETPVLNIADDPIPVIQEPGAEAAECDFVFRAGRRAFSKENGKPPEAADDAGEKSSSGNARRGFVIDAGAGRPAPSNSILSMPLFDGREENLARAAESGARLFVCPHAATIALAGLTLRLAAELEIRHISALVFTPASELGPDAIDELQKQTIALLNFGDVPRRVFGAQAAFNVSPRMGGKTNSALGAIESRVRTELGRLLDSRAPVPALRLVQAPSFYSMAFSIYVQSPQRTTAVQIEQAISGEGLEWVRSSRPSPSPVDAQGSAALLLDPVVEDTGPSGGFWLWGRVDDLRLAAENAVAIAERLIPFLSRP